MCGRYSLFTDENSREILQIVQEVGSRHPAMKTGEIFPTNTAPILRQEGQAIHADAAIWGFPPFGQKGGVLINARAETAFEKIRFRESLLSRRCVVPSTGFYEWSRDASRQKYRFLLPNSRALYMAGIYTEYKGEKRFVILTTEGNASVRDIHPRMPVVLRTDQIEEWIKNPEKTAALLQGRQPALERRPA